MDFVEIYNVIKMSSGLKRLLISFIMNCIFRVGAQYHSIQSNFFGTGVTGRRR
jgi:hypothetical protein